MMLIFMTMIILLITNIMMLIVNLISKKSFKDREKSSPFECGFDPKNSARLPFSLQFFLIAMIFLIFDVEITLIIPFIFTLSITNILIYSMLIFSFIMILLLGLYHEWNQGALNWKI
uniref:NADH-ubiquinone oxidoreductase chain 3 n=1 Tax=Nephus voeltzkowi TaxID=2233631 RepID=A0A6M3WDH3_9CUCU|nr:NADH dehydrogenase subunit 3 [Nephus voeltzkowi]QJF72905.1 NADH dehydrogenase subunit 3 [Nephus voeltzkowi]QJF72918.1 NADH dehydrogenase subunit 3 [Nephus voeltzkowi]QJF72931.1 NADH dehydrogenase subunit 3 [Nephus voeltzkowi]